MQITGDMDTHISADFIATLTLKLHTNDKGLNHEKRLFCQDQDLTKGSFVPRCYL